MGGKRRRLRILVGFIKDKASLIKATLSISSSNRSSSISVAVIRATTHDTSAPPTENRISAVLGGGGGGSRHTSRACVEALMDRLHRTGSAAVALKCLLVAHSIATRGSFILKDQLSFYPSSGGQNFLNLSTFRDESDSDTWELSSWVRWYAGLVEQNLMVSRALGYYLSHHSSSSKYHDNVLALSSSELLSEVEVLVDYVERTRHAPEHLNLDRTNGLVYEVLRMAGEEYRLVQGELLCRVKELGDRTTSINNDKRFSISSSDSGELNRLLNALKRLEDCKERLLSLFLNRRRDGEFWDAVSEVKMKVEEMVEKRDVEAKRVVVWVGARRVNQSSESTRVWNPQPVGTVVPVVF